MESDRLNRWLTLCANIGVLIGIVLLLIELNQNQEIARAQTRNEISLGVTGVLSILDRDLAEILVRANAGEELQPADQILISRWSEALLRYWENSNYQYEIGLYDEAEYSAQKIIIRVGITELFPGALIPHYCQYKFGYSEHFTSVIDEFVSQEMCAE